jgi:hypothetical protein
MLLIVLHLILQMLILGIEKEDPDAQIPAEIMVVWFL